ncbi:sugar transferase [Staphylococcus croceilyticus]|uniref:Sugar transferase n=1 Tax=Staphylococcus croceilyticus TaxID=319942 RepID=A0ABY2KHW6_9STAP|nr:UDP-phosphate N-acetylgalactosaminyl-1-phosphate transferase [Staphylococcus croceilyticus]TGA81094.1 sugar transferase [Staphylococcus croceilyticus]
MEKWYYPLKRLLDVLMSIILLYFTFPIMVLFAVLIVIDSFGNPIYKQIRVGKNGKLITIYKLRSMKLNAECNGAQWAEKDDPRITKVGKFIRKTRIDELPQLLNVLKGEMSFIGPRPERPEFVELFSSEIQGFEKRCLVTPGLTGLAQVKGGYDLSPKEKLKYDLKYIYKGNIFTEIYICLKTINIIITGSGSR